MNVVFTTNSERTLVFLKEIRFYVYVIYLFYGV